MEVLKTIVG